MSDEEENKTIIVRRHKALENILDKWMVERGVNEAPSHIQEILISTFYEGWSSCASHTLQESIDLAFIILSLLQKSEADSEETVLQLDSTLVNKLKFICQKIIGDELTDEDETMFSILNQQKHRPSNERLPN